VGADAAHLDITVRAQAFAAHCDQAAGGAKTDVATHFDRLHGERPGPGEVGEREHLPGIARTERLRPGFTHGEGLLEHHLADLEGSHDPEAVCFHIGECTRHGDLFAGSNERGEIGQ
jgi:hypothetical protein